MKKLVIIDNYDSFTYNLVQLFLLFDLEIAVFRNDRVTIPDIEKQAPDYIVISPGPKTPAAAGISIPLILALAGKTPILGVCLGMQCLNEAFGGQTARSPAPLHGKSDEIRHIGDNLFAGLPSPFSAARYHSLICRPVSKALRVSAFTKDNLVMGLAHPEQPLYGVQFHPESFLTEHGAQLAKNFLATKIL